MIWKWTHNFRNHRFYRFSNSRIVDRFRLYFFPFFITAQSHYDSISNFHRQFRLLLILIERLDLPIALPLCATMSRIIAIIASIMLKAVVLIAAQSLPTRSVNHDRKVEHVDVATNKIVSTSATSRWDAHLPEVKQWLDGIEARSGPIALFPGKRRRDVLIPQWKIDMALCSGHTDLLDEDAFVGIYNVSVAEFKRRVRTDVEDVDESPDFDDIM